MTCHSCSIDCVKAGKYGRKRVQRYLCKQCGKRYSEPQDKPLGDVRLPDEKVLLILHCLVEGNSVRGTARLCDVEKRTVLTILKAAGENCERLLERRIRNVPSITLSLMKSGRFAGRKSAERRERKRREPTSAINTFHRA